MQRRDTGIAQSLGKPLLKRVKDSRVLLVGAGGIGCEVLKNLVCCGFGTSSAPPSAAAVDEQESPVKPSSPHEPRPEIVVIDLDTIDLSNLNRQFLFRKHHIKKSKALVAKETASQFNPSANIDSQHGSIFDARYNVSFFESFDLVFNALDNLAARRHVNKMCLAADVPLIESGTTGFNGNVQAIQKGHTECYDCTPKPPQKSFPICTIRSTPSQPIHCIVWAKSYLFPELFGTSEEESKDVAVTEEDNTEEVAKLRIEAEALKKVRSLMGKSEFAQAVFHKVFHDDVERLRSMSEMWQNRKAPEPLKFEDLSAESNNTLEGGALALQDQVIWTLDQNLAVFSSSVHALSQRVEAGESVIEFDKDDKDTLDFVASAANLRSHIFGIPLHSEWEIKKMAGNIIPAIATSNALTASLCVLEAFKIMRHMPTREEKFTQSNTHHHLSTSMAQTTINGKEPGVLGGAKMMYLQSGSTERLLQSGPHGPPSRECPVCAPIYIKLAIQPESTPKLQELVDLLQTKIGYDDFSIMSSSDAVIYDPDLKDNLEKSFDELGIDVNGNGFMTIMDDSDEPRVDVILSAHTSAGHPTGTAPRLEFAPAEVKVPLKPQRVVAFEDNTQDAKVDDDDVVMNDAAAGTKRKREASDDSLSMNASKKVKATTLVVEDDGAIVLDDD
nr:ubiquitin-activating enzyme e1-like [Quercus suber]